MTIFHSKKIRRSEFDTLAQYFFRFFIIISGKPGKYLSFLKHIAKKNLNLDSGNSNLVTNSDLFTNPDLVTGFGPGVMSGPCHPASNV